MARRDLLSAVALGLLEFFAATAALALAGADRGARVPGDENWSDRFGYYGAGFNQQILCSTVFEGYLVVGGIFDGVGSVPAYRLARWDGTRWSPMPGRFHGDHYGDGVVITGLTVYDGDLIVAGWFDSVAGVPARNIARFDGVQWRALGTGLDERAFAFAQYDGRLIATGMFSEAGGVSASCVAAWDGSAWSALGTGLTLSTGDLPIGYRLCVYHRDLIVSGTFDRAGGVMARMTARWDGSSWHGLHWGMLPVNIEGIRTLDVYQDHLIAGGRFSWADTVAVNNVAQWDGTQWSSVGSGLGTMPYTSVQFGGLLIMGGGFDFPGSPHVAAWNGATWSPYTTGTDPEVHGLIEYGDDVIAAGCFQQAGGLPAARIARFQMAAPGACLSDSCLAFAKYEGGTVAGGYFGHAGDVDVRGLALWDGNGWHDICDGADGTVRTLAVYRGGLIVGGDFLSVANHHFDANHVARWNGTAWARLGSGLDARPRSLAISDGLLVAGGDFNSAGGIPSHHIAGWNGASWTPFGSGMDGNVSALADYFGDLVAGGSFITAGGVEARHVALWDGSGWRALEDGLDGEVEALTVYHGNLIAGGSFTHAGVIAVDHLARWNGSSWEPVGGGVQGTIGATVSALHVSQDHLLVGGLFDRVGGNLPAHCIARWDDSSGWTVFGSGVSGHVLALSPTTTGFFAGGDFLIAGDRFSPCLALWETEPAEIVDSTFDTPPEVSFMNPYPVGSPILLDLPRACAAVDATLYDVLGRRVRVLFRGDLAAGPRELKWDGRSDTGIPAGRGVYLLRVIGGGTTATGRLVLRP
jgi:hypothetical protein